MRPIPPGSSATVHLKVSADMTVHFDELGRLHPVYATYSMARHFEEAGRKLLLPYLEEGEDALGSELSVRHTASALPGMRVSVTASLDRVEGRKLFCTLRAVSELGDELGTGHTVQVVLPRARIEAGFEALRARWQVAATPPSDEMPDPARRGG